MRLTVAETASLLDASEERVYDWIEDEGLPAQRIRGQYRINRTELLEWATERNLTLAPRAFEQSPNETATPSIAGALLLGDIHYGVPAHDASVVARSIASNLPLANESDREVLVQFLIARESLGLSIIADAIAVPQVRKPVILPIRRGSTESQLVSLSFLTAPLMFGDRTSRAAVDTIFLVVSPTVTAHVAMIARLTSCIGDSEFRAVLRKRGPASDILRAAAAAEGKL